MQASSSNNLLDTVKPNFNSWIDKIIKEKHISSDADEFIKHKFTEKFNTVTSTTYPHSFQEFSIFLERAVTDKHITSGNAKHIKVKAEKVLLQEFAVSSPIHKKPNISLSSPQ